MVPPIPKWFPDAPDNEIVDFVSKLPPAQSPTEEAPEASEGRTRKRAQSSRESSDALTLPTPRDPPCLVHRSGGDGASSSPIPAVSRYILFWSYSFSSAG